MDLTPQPLTNIKSMNKTKAIDVFMDDDANYCVITGTTDRSEAEKALRKQEIGWYGENHEEKPIPIDDFYLADILYGEKSGEGFYYWGHEPLGKFDDNKYEIIEGFIANLD